MAQAQIQIERLRSGVSETGQHDWQKGLFEIISEKKYGRDKQTD